MGEHRGIKYESKILVTGSSAIDAHALITSATIPLESRLTLPNTLNKTANQLSTWAFKNTMLATFSSGVKSSIGCFRKPSASRGEVSG